MVLANVAWILASNGKRVLAIDWDLEAPGLHRYFAPFLLDKSLAWSDGLMDFVRNFETEALTQPPLPEGADPSARDWYKPLADLSRYTLRLNWDFANGGLLDFVPAGRQSPDYSNRVNSFDWKNFYERLGGGAFLDAARQAVGERYQYVLIDSRTGVSDTSGICTVQMPNTLVVCFTANNQSIDGSAGIAASVRNQWTRFEGRGVTPPRIFPLLMRTDDNEKDKLDAARLYVKARFNQFLEHLQGQEQEYWQAVEIPYKPYYNYEEVLATFADDPGRKGTFLAAVEYLTRYITRPPVDRMIPLLSEDRKKVLSCYERAPRLAPVGAVSSPVSWTPKKVERLALTLSGGGFRAAMFHLGVIRLLYETNLLPKITHITAVSGGSILAAHLVLNWERYTGSEATFAAVSRELVEFTAHDVRGHITRCKLLSMLVPWAWFGSAPFLGSRLLQTAYESLYRGQSLMELRGTDFKAPELHILASSLTTGALWSFTWSGCFFYDGNVWRHFAGQSLPVALAVAASSALPALVDPVRLTQYTLRVSENEFPIPQYLADGGILENLGLSHLQWLRQEKGLQFDYVLLSDAQTAFDRAPTRPLIRALAWSARANELAMSRAGDLVYQLAAHGVGADQSFYVTCRLRDIVQSTEGQNTLDLRVQRQLASMRIDLDPLSPAEAYLLMRHGYEVALQALRRVGIPGVAGPEFHSQVGNSLSFWRESEGGPNVAHLDLEAKGASRLKLRLWAPGDWASWAIVGLLALYFTLGIGLAVWPTSVTNTKLAHENALLADKNAALGIELKLASQRLQEVAPLQPSQVSITQVANVVKKEPHSVSAVLEFDRPVPNAPGIMVVKLEAGHRVRLAVSPVWTETRGPPADVDRPTKRLWAKWNPEKDGLLPESLPKSSAEIYSWASPKSP
jgi:predicted acylesterase/phospholipase RssA